MNILLGVFIGGGLGAVARYGIGLTLLKINGDFPWATLAANVLACSIAAIAIYTLPKTEEVKAWALVGFCGGFSTFSTFSLETFHLIQNGHWQWALLNVLISLLAGLGVFWVFARKG